MIKIDFNAKEGHIKVSGHSNQAPKGKDIVCAGVSAIVNGMYLYFLNIKEKEGKDSKTEIIYDTKDVQFEVKYDIENLTNVIICSVFSLMLSQFEAYPDFVEINYTDFDVEHYKKLVEKNMENGRKNHNKHKRHIN